MKALKLSKVKAGLVGLTLTGTILTFATVLSAQVSPTITTTIQNGSNVAVTSMPINSLVHANAVVASSTGPEATGTVDFALYPNTTCSGVATTQSGVALLLGVANSATTTVGSSGLSYKVHYNGLTDIYPPTDGQCQSLTATAANVTLNTTLSTTTAVVGTSVFSSATLGGATANASGTVAYKVFSDNVCSVMTNDTGTKTVTNAVVPNSDSLAFNSVGTFYLRAVYSGDANNNVATSTCRTLTINATTTPPVVTPNPGSISGTVYNDSNKSLVRDAGEIGLSGWVINLYTGNGWSRKGTRSPFMTATTDSNGNYIFNSVPVGSYSIEEINQTGWKQLTSDFNNVSLASSSQITGKDFANATSTAKEIKKQDKRDKQLMKLFDKRFKAFQNFMKHFEKFHGKNGKGHDKNHDDDENDD